MVTHNTDSVLPAETLATNLSLEGVNFDEAKILALIKVLNANKAHGWDEISIQMIQICDRSLVKPLMKMFRFSLDCGVFPEKWKKSECNSSL